MKILQLNIRSLNTSKYQLRDYIRDRKIDIACLTETWHKGDDNSIKDITGLIPEFKDRSLSSKGGGAAILVSPNIKAVRRKDLEDDSLEAAFCGNYHQWEMHYHSLSLHPTRPHS